MFECLVVNSTGWLVMHCGCTNAHKCFQVQTPHTCWVINCITTHLPSPSTSNTIHICICHHLHLPPSASTTICICHHPHPPSSASASTTRFLFSKFFFLYIHLCLLTNTSAHQHIFTHASACQRICTSMHPHAHASTCQCIHPHTSTQPVEDVKYVDRQLCQ